MSFSKWIFMGIVCCFLLIPGIGRCAQSSADVSASKELKENVRKDILGAKADELNFGDDYVIGIGDLLDVSIFGEGDMAAASPGAANSATGGPNANAQANAAQGSSGRAEVRTDGQISLKHIGDVKAAGMTLPQLADYLKKLYAPLFDDPVVTTVLAKNNSTKYSVMGKVMKPGVYPLTIQMTLIEAVARCDGFNEWAKRVVTVIRNDVREKDKEMFKNNSLEFDYDDYLKGKNAQKNIDIQAGDLIVVR
jgi:polysaccharide biosynthesis/export protein